MIDFYSKILCPYCVIVRRKLDKLGLEYNSIRVSRSRKNRTEIIELSGQSLVPIIVDDGKVVNDSAVIVRYLEEKYGGE